MTKLKTYEVYVPFPMKDIILIVRAKNKKEAVDRVMKNYKSQTAGYNKRTMMAYTYLR